MQVMLPRIAMAWESLHVPLIHRSRFYLAFRGREAFYFEAEQRRLAWLQSEIGNPEDPDGAKAQKARRALARNQRKLDVRPRFLVQMRNHAPSSISSFQRPLLLPGGEI